MENPLVSFILPIFNNNNTIIPTIKSLIAQDYIEKEIIVVDDSSTDNSVKLIEKFIKKYTYIKLIVQPALGKINCLKSGLSQAQGSYIMFVDPGKIYIDSMTKYLISFSSGQDEIISTDFFSITESEYYNFIEISKKSPMENLSEYSGKKFIKNLHSGLDHDFENCISLWNKFIKKSILSNLNFQDYKTILSLAKSILSSSKKILVSNQILICNVLIDQYYNENCFKYQNLDTIDFLEEVLIDCKTRKDIKRNI